MQDTRARRQLIGLTWGALVSVVGCNSTPVDAIVPQRDAAVTPNECSTGVATVAPGQFKLRSVATGQCVAVGAATFVAGTPARLTALVDDCASGGIWRVTVTNFLPSGTFYEFSTPERAYVFDVEMGQSADGTPVVLYAPATVGRANQAFDVRTRGANSFELAPAHVTGTQSCVGVDGDSLAISGCDANARAQEWQLLPATCP